MSDNHGGQVATSQLKSIPLWGIKLMMQVKVWWYYGREEMCNTLSSLKIIYNQTSLPDFWF